MDYTLISLAIVCLIASAMMVRPRRRQPGSTQ